MKAKRFTDEQIIAVLREAEAGAKATELCRKHGISEPTFYNWLGSLAWAAWRSRTSLCARIPSAGSADTAAVPAPRSAVATERPKLIYAPSGNALFRRLEALPNNAMQLFARTLLPNSQADLPFIRQNKSLLRRVNRWRKDTRARGVVIGPKTYRRISHKPRGRRADAFKNHWHEMVP